MGSEDTDSRKVDTKRLSEFLYDAMMAIAIREGLVPEDNSHKAFRTIASVMSNVELFKEAIKIASEKYKQETGD